MPPSGRPTLSSGINGRMDVLDYIRANSPARVSVRALCNALGYRSPATIHGHLRRLQIDGLIRRTSRGWEVA